MTIKRGYTYPLTVENGSLKLSTDSDLVAEAIYSVLETRPQERIMRPRYGLPDFVLESVSNQFFIPARIEVALRDQVADPKSFTVSGDYSDAGTLTIDVNYTLETVQEPPIQFKLRM